MKVLLNTGEDSGASFTSHNGGVHLVIDGPNDKVDFWPSTGLWKPRSEKLQRRGVRKLLAYLNA